MGEEGQHMDDSLYRAAQLRGANIPGPAEVNFQSRTMGDRNNALHVAAQYNNHEFIRGAVNQLGQYRYQLLCQQNSKGETPLHLAAQLGHVETARVLVRAHYHEEGSGPFNYPRRPCWSERDERGDTPLHKALRNGREDTAMFLLDTDFQVVSVDNNAGESVAYLAAESFCSKFLARILDAHNRYFLSFSGPFGQTVFHPARRLTKELMQKLIEIRGRPLLKIQDKEGKTVVHYAVEEDRPTMVMALLSADSSLAYLHNTDGLTPLHIAFKKGLFGMVRVILEVSPQSLEIRDSHGKTALHNANMSYCFLAKCRTINLRMDLLINQVDKDGNTPLHVALINSEQDAAFQLLWFSGCNWRLRNKEGYNPLDLCKSNHKISYMSAVHVALRDLEGVRQGLRIRKWIEIRFLASIRSICWVTLDGMEEKKLKKLLNEIAVAAALLLPLNFITAFNVPGGYDKSTGQPMLRNQFAFQLFNYSNMAAFFATVCILFSCTFGFGKRMSKKRLAQCSILLIQVALITTISAYFFGLLAIGSTSYWGSAVIIFIVLVIELSIMN